MGATTEQAWIDDVKINGSCYKMDIEFNTTSVVEASNYYLQLNYNVTSGENYDVRVYNGATWDDMGDLTSETRWTYLQITLNSNQRLGSGYVRVRFVGKTEAGDSTQSKLYIEYHRIRSYGTLNAPFSSVNVILTGENDNDKFGYSVSDAGNVNGDSYDDVIVGAPGYDSDRGKAYIYTEHANITGDAGTTLYNFSSGGGSNKWATEYDEKGALSSTNGPEPDGATADISTNTAIANSDDTRYSTTINTASNWVYHHFKFTISTYVLAITSLTVSWEGYGDQTASMFTYGTLLVVVGTL